MKSFEEYLKEGVAKKHSPDLLRAKSLIQESENDCQVLADLIKLSGITEKNANHIIKNSYDIFMPLIRAKMLIKGYSSTGQGAHEAEVAFMRELGFQETEVEFADNIRFFRNSILYYGKKYDAELAQKIFEFAEKIAKKLK